MVQYNNNKSNPLDVGGQRSDVLIIIVTEIMFSCVAKNNHIHVLSRKYEGNANAFR